MPYLIDSLAPRKFHSWERAGATEFSPARPLFCRISLRTT